MDRRFGPALPYTYEYCSTEPIPADTGRFTYDWRGSIRTATNHDAAITRRYFPGGALKADTIRIREYAGGPPEQDAPDAVAGGHTFDVIAGGLHHGCGIATDGLAYCWGANGAGQVGDGGQAQANTPTLVSRQQP